MVEGMAQTMHRDTSVEEDAMLRTQQVGERVNAQVNRQ
jgi:hypothetical protein